MVGMREYYVDRSGMKVNGKAKGLADVVHRLFYRWVFP